MFARRPARRGAPRADLVIARGEIERVEGGMLVARLPRARIGACATVGEHRVTADVRRIDGSFAWLAAHGPIEGLARGTPVTLDDSASLLALGACALGRAIDARGRPLDGGAPLHGRFVPVGTSAPLQRVRVCEPLWSGVRCIDALLTLGKGSRAGLFGAPGAGKSWLLERFARSGAVDVVVVGLVGERGREAQEWCERIDARTTVVCATSDRPAAERWRAARVAFAQARALHERGLDVLLVLDSLARTANALRELALEAGEPPGRGGYPPSVFAELARLVEMAGVTARGSVTLVATVLEDGDERDPVSDAARSFLDAHVQLSNALLRARRLPAIDVAASASRVMDGVTDEEHVRAATTVRAAIAALSGSEDARSLGIDAHGDVVEAAVRHEEKIEAFVRQGAQGAAPAESRAALLALAAEIDGSLRGHQAATLR